MQYEIKKNTEYRLFEKRSEFITRFYKVYSVKEADDIIKSIKLKEKNASHNCHAYRILNGSTVIESRSDDGEPGGTAGAPMLGVISGNNLVNILCITTRYFGGTKLGTGGLVKAYSEGIKKTIEISELVEFTYKQEFTISFRINNTGKINYYIENNNIEVNDKEFSDFVKYTLLLTEEQKNKLTSDLSDIIQIK